MQPEDVCDFVERTLSRTLAIKPTGGRQTARDTVHQELAEDIAQGLSARKE